MFCIRIGRARIAADRPEQQGIEHQQVGIGHALLHRLELRLVLVLERRAQVTSLLIAQGFRVRHRAGHRQCVAIVRGSRRRGVIRCAARARRIGPHLGVLGQAAMAMWIALAVP